MKTHTIRYNGNKTGKIITFTKPFMNKLLVCEDMAVAIFVHSVLKSITAQLGIPCTVDLEQVDELNHHKEPQPFNLSPDLHRIHNWFLLGIRTVDVDFERFLEILQTYAVMMNTFNNKDQ